MDSARLKARRRAGFASPAAEESQPDGNEAQIARVNEIIRNTRAIWFTLLGALVFAGITLLGVEDRDFFAVARETRLPLVGVSVPVEYFFGGGAVLICAFYVYLLITMETLWAELGRLPAQVDNAPVGHKLFPGLVSEWALRRRDRLAARDAGQARRGTAAPLKAQYSPDRALGGSARTRCRCSSFWSGWFGLAVLVLFWWKSMPAHYARR